ncbi:MAG: NAD(+) synthase, partial [Clostridia bacterium]|nr:NAD(+) synthase [Clostridia bacterium]
MKYGYVKVCAATPEIRVADVAYNTHNIIKAIKESAVAGSQLTVFPELCVCGYTCGDLFNQSALLATVEAALVQIAEATTGSKALIFVGAPVRSSGRLYNCAVAMSDGKILGVVPKTNIPNYGEFYEKRYFNSFTGGDSVVSIGGKEISFGSDLIFSSENSEKFTVAAEICEDLWAPQSPSVSHTKAGANIIVNLSCSDETVGKAEYRRMLVKTQSAKLICGYVYSDAGDGESTTDMVFAGHNLICENGGVLNESKLFENGLIYGEIDVDFIAAERARCASAYYGECDGQSAAHRIIKFFSNEEGEPTRLYPRTPFIPENGMDDRSELILTIQQKGLEKRLKHVNSLTAVIGISGGLDSALALLVTCRAFKALGRNSKDIIAVTMPGFGTTQKTKGNSVKLAEALGAT